MRTFIFFRVMPFLAGIGLVAVIAFAVGRIRQPQTVIVERRTVVVLVSCAELDRMGYDGKASCVNEDNEIVRVGG